MPITFDTDTIFRSQKTTADETALIDSVLAEAKRLHKLMEDARPSNNQETQRRVDAANASLIANPSTGTVDTFLAEVGLAQNPQRVFEKLEETLNEMIDTALAKLDPVAERLHSAAVAAAQDPKQFGLADVDKIKDIAERGAALVEFSSGHKNALAMLEREGAIIGTKRGSLNLLSRHGFAEAIYG